MGCNNNKMKTEKITNTNKMKMIIVMEMKQTGKEQNEETK